MKKQIKVMDTSFRDGLQSIFGARVLSKDYLCAVEALKDAGINHFEFGGGALFQSPFFYCNENAFDVMDSFRKIVGPDVNLQTLARGVNVVGLESLSADLIRLHAQLFKKHGATTIRNFDALNDVNNLIFSGKCIKEAGLKHQIVISMMELPPQCRATYAHTAEFYADILKQILKAEIEFDSLCFKDASGTSTPSKVYQTIKEAKKNLPSGTEITFHTHETAGISVRAYQAALEASADCIDLAMKPVSGGTSQPDIITMWHALRGTEFDLGIDLDKTIEAQKILTESLKSYFVPPEARAVDPLIVCSPMPGGALTANTQMLRDNNILDKYPEIIRAMGEVVEKGGHGTSVTPVSQFYFQQAFNNVMFGPWKKIAEGYGKMVLGYFGKTPVPAHAEIIKLAAEQLHLEPTTKTALELNNADAKKTVKYYQSMLEENNIPLSDENIFIAATCKEKGIDFLKGHATVSVRKANALPAPETKSESHNYSVTVGDKTYIIKLNDDNTATVDGVDYDFDISHHKGEETTAAAVTKSTSSGQSTAVRSPLPGTVISIKVKEGDLVKTNDTLFVIESLKMEIPIPSPADGKITNIKISQSMTIVADQEVATIIH